MGTTVAKLIVWAKRVKRQPDALGRYRQDFPVTCVECLVSFDVNDPGCPSCCGRVSLPARVLAPRLGWRG